ncbi:MAG: hypothetical protein ACUVUU_07920 [bacterium]
MNLQLKSALIIIVTMIIGILIGTFIVAPLAARRYLAMMETLRHRAGLAYGIERMILPDRSQKEYVKPVIRKYSERFEMLFQKHRKDVQALVDSLEAELNPLLTEEQKQRLERIRSRGWRHPPRKW